MRVLGKALYALVFTAVVLGCAWTAVELLGNPEAPPRPAAAHGAGFRLERGAQHVAHVSGDPYAMGLHNARILGSLMDAQEESLVDLLFSFAGGGGRAYLIRGLSLLYIAGLDSYLTAAERQEILGLAEGNPDPMPELGPRYGRIAAYHAIHELSQRFAVDNPLMACSLVAVGAKRGAGGHALLGRNFDFEGGEVFDRDKVVLAVRPTDGFGFVSVIWAGMAGVVSGMNERGLTIVINAAASSDWRRVGAPTTLLVRRALQRAETIDEAVAILTSAPTFVTDIMGLADASGRVAVLELTPRRHALREGDVLVATNHLESELLAQDPVSEERKQFTTTVPRHERLDRLVATHPAPFGVTDLLAMLRDRSRVDGTTLPLGHRHAVDALIASHSVIFDATARRLWVSEGPHTLGPYHGYDVPALIRAATAEEAEAASLPSLPADPVLQVYPQVVRGREAWAEARAAFEASDLNRMEAALRQAVVVGDHPNTLRLRAELARTRGEKDWARRFLAEALRAPIEFPEEAAQVRAALDELGGQR